MGVGGKTISDRGRGVVASLAVGEGVNGGLASIGADTIAILEASGTRVVVAQRVFALGIVDVHRGLVANSGAVTAVGDVSGEVDVASKKDVSTAVAEAILTLNTRAAVLAGIESASGARLGVRDRVASDIASTAETLGAGAGDVGLTTVAAISSVSKITIAVGGTRSAGGDASASDALSAVSNVKGGISARLVARSAGGGISRRGLATVITRAALEATSAGVRAASSSASANTGSIDSAIAGNTASTAVTIGVELSLAAGGSVRAVTVAGGAVVGAGEGGLVAGRGAVGVGERVVTVGGAATALGVEVHVSLASINGGVAIALAGSALVNASGGGGRGVASGASGGTSM